MVDNDNGWGHGLRSWVMFDEWLVVVCSDWFMVNGWFMVIYAWYDLLFSIINGVIILTMISAVNEGECSNHATITFDQLLNSGSTSRFDNKQSFSHLNINEQPLHQASAALCRHRQAPLLLLRKIHLMRRTLWQLEKFPLCLVSIVVMNHEQEEGWFYHVFCRQAAPSWEIHEVLNWREITGYWGWTAAALMMLGYNQQKEGLHGFAGV